MERRFAALLVAVAFVVALIAVPQQAQGATVYALTVEAGKYYAFIPPFSSIGVAAYHSVYGSLPVYRWDLNESYYIFYSPAAGTVYIYPQQVSNAIMSTQEWFIPDQLTVLQYNVTVTHFYACPTCSTPCSVLINAYRETLYAPVWRSNATIAAVYFDGSRVIANVSSATVSISYSKSEISYGGFTSECLPSTCQLNFTFTLNMSISSFSSSGHYLLVGGYRACDAAACLDNYFATGVYGGYLYLASISSAYHSPVLLNDTAFMYWRSYSYTSSRTLAPPITQYLFNLKFNVPAILSLSSFTVVLATASNNVLVARNGNTIVLANPKPASGVTVSRASITAFATQLTLQTNTTSWILISLSKPHTVDERLVNPVLVLDKVYAGYYTVADDTYIMLFKIDGAWSGTAFVAWMFPRSIASSVRYDVSVNDISSYIVLINGSAIYVSDLFAVEDGSVIGFFNYYRLIRLDYTGEVEFEDPVIVQVNGEVYVLTHPQTRITAIEGAVFASSVLDISPPLPITLESSVYVNYTVGEYVTISIPFELLSSLTSVSGTWGYRIPVHISLGAQPMGLLVLRLELPLGTWVKQGLLSPGLEDLLIVDWENRPVFFYLSYWKTHETAVVYVRLNKPPAGTTFTLYILLYNRALWGTGVSYASIATFDFVNPPQPFPTYGLYNTVTLRPLPRWIKLYTTSADYVVYYLNGTLLECHGAYCTAYQVDPILGGRELVVRTSDTVFSVFVDGYPAFSVDVSSLTYYQNVSEAYRTITLVEYESVEFAAHYHSVPYTYSIGYLQGGLYLAPRQQVQGSGQAVQEQPSPWGTFFNLLPMIIILVILGVVMRFISQREAPPPREVVRLP